MRQGQSKSLVFGNGVSRTRVLPIPQNWRLAGIKSGLTFADHCFTGSGRTVMNAFLPVRRMLSSPEGQAILASMSSPDGFPMTATGWTWAGGSSGRGCNAKTDRTSVWLRPLCRDWRDEPGVSEPGHAPPPRPTCALAPSGGPAVNVRAQNEFGAAPFGKARARRLVKSAGMQSMAPSKTFLPPPAAATPCRGIVA